MSPATIARSSSICRSEDRERGRSTRGHTADELLVTTRQGRYAKLKLGVIVVARDGTWRRLIAPTERPLSAYASHDGHSVVLFEVKPRGGRMDYFPILPH